MANNSTSTTTLNTLIGTLLDSIEGYQQSAQATENQQLAQRFQSRARERQQAVASLQAAVARLGGNPEDDSTTLGGAHRVFLKLKEAVVGRDDQTIINEVERGEDYLKGKFETALKSTDLEPEARSAIDEAWSTVREGHDEMSRIKHEMQGYRQGAQDAQQQNSDSGQAYASENRTGTTTGGTYSGMDTAQHGGAMGATDTYQQDAGGYPGTISPNDGSGSTVGGGNRT